MAQFEFDSQHECPKCGAAIERAERKEEYSPVVVVVCPGCSALLWRAGFDESSPLVPFDPDQDAGGI